MTDRRTDRQTHDNSLYRASTASRGENQGARLVLLKDAVKTNGLTDTTDRIIFPAKAADQSEIDADSVRIKVYSTVHLQDCASDFRGNRVRIAFRTCEHYTGWTKKRSHRLMTVILSNFNRLRLLAVCWPGVQSA